MTAGAVRGTGAVNGGVDHESARAQLVEAGAALSVPDMADPRLWRCLRAWCPDPSPASPHLSLVPLTRRWCYHWCPSPISTRDFPQFREASTDPAPGMVVFDVLNNLLSWSPTTGLRSLLVWDRSTLEELLFFFFHGQGLVYALLCVKARGDRMRQGVIA